MIVMIHFQNKKVPVYSDDTNEKKKLGLLKAALEHKLIKGKKAIKTCLNSLISIEIIGSEAILHAHNERDTLVLSLY